MRLPDDIDSHEQPGTHWYHQLRDYLRSITGQSSADIRAEVTPGGTRYFLVNRPLSTLNPSPSTPPPRNLWCAPNGTANQIDITLGNLQHVFNGFAFEIPALTAHTVADGDKAWVARTGANTWASATGADWPTTQIFVKLVDKISVDDDGAVTIDDADRWWDGGDLIVPEIFPVTVTGDSSDPPVYTVKTLAASGGVDITADTPSGVPTNYRDANLSYKAGPCGVAKIIADGSFVFFVEDEYADHETKCVAIVTTGPDSNGCYTIAPAQYSLTKLKSPGTCP